MPLTSVTCRPGCAHGHMCPSADLASRSLPAEALLAWIIGRLSPFFDEDTHFLIFGSAVASDPWLLRNTWSCDGVGVSLLPLFLWD